MPLESLGRFFKSLAGHLIESGQAHVPVHFALHGGEPLLLPPEYLRGLLALQQEYLGARGIVYRNSAQTNLYRVSEQTLALCEELQIGLGVSLDVHGGQRVDAQGRDAETRVKNNLRQLVADGLPQRLRMGGISVLHAGNAAQAPGTFRFFAELGLDYRILPIFSMSEPDARIKDLMMTQAQVTQALLAVWHERLSWRGRQIRVYPLEEYLDAAVRQVSGQRAAAYDPAQAEWALIVDTGGDAYNHSETYTADYRLGNVFTQSVRDIFRSAARARLQQLREERVAVCKACAYGDSCSRIPMIEALPSERERDMAGTLQCGVAQPLIGYLATQIERTPSLHSLLAS